jgi:xylulokinase
VLLGLDIGTTRIKAVAIDAAGTERDGASVATPFAASADGIDMSVADFERALRRVVAALGPTREEVAAVGVSGMAESGAPFRAGRPVGPIIAWHDGRGEQTVASLEQRFGADLPGWTGRRLRTVSSLAKLGWLLDHGVPMPERWLGVPELVLFLLTGTEATEHSLAARTGAYHVIERRWITEVLDHLDLRRDAFPDVWSAGGPMGWVSEHAAAAYGLPAGTPVTIAGHDHLAAGAGLGAAPDDLLNSVGTAETLLRRLDTAPDVDRALELDLAVTLWPGGDAWCVLASAARSGLVIEALAVHLGMQPAALDNIAAAGAADPSSGRTGETVALGQGVEVAAGPPAVMWKETLDALARRTAAAAERVSVLAGPSRRLVVFGGGSRSRAWAEAKAAALGVPVVRCPVPEAAARGAALAAGAAAGWWPVPSAGPTRPLDAPGSACRGAAETMGSS